MIIINVHCDVDPARREAFMDFAKELVNKSRRDTGNLFYSYFEDALVPNHFLIVEHWQDQKAVDAHNQTPHLQTLLKTANTYLTHNFDIQVSHTDN